MVRRLINSGRNLLSDETFDIPVESDTTFKVVALKSGINTSYQDLTDRRDRIRSQPDMYITPRAVALVAAALDVNHSLVNGELVDPSESTGSLLDQSLRCQGGHTIGLDESGVGLGTIYNTASLNVLAAASPQKYFQPKQTITQRLLKMLSGFAA